MPPVGNLDHDRTLAISSSGADLPHAIERPPQRGHRFESRTVGSVVAVDGNEDVGRESWRRPAADHKMKCDHDRDDTEEPAQLWPSQ